MLINISLSNKVKDNYIFFIFNNKREYMRNE